jgi:hypothetical protein
LEEEGLELDVPTKRLRGLLLDATGLSIPSTASKGVAVVFDIEYMKLMALHSRFQIFQV